LGPQTEPGRSLIAESPCYLRHPHAPARRFAEDACLVLVADLVESTGATRLDMIHAPYTSSTTEKRARTLGPTLAGLPVAASMGHYSAAADAILQFRVQFSRHGLRVHVGPP
jgi:hypothetical protein